MITRDDRLTEQLVEEIEATSKPFWPANLGWTGDGHWPRLDRVITGLEWSGLIRPLDLRSGIHFVRTDIPCDVTEPVMTVYRLFDAAGALLYIGCTSKPLDVRLRAHSKDKDWWLLTVASTTKQSVSGWHEGHRVERDAITSEAPLFNVVFNASRHLRDAA